LKAFMFKRRKKLFVAHIVKFNAAKENTLVYICN